MHLTLSTSDGVLQDISVTQKKPFAVFLLIITLDLDELFYMTVSTSQDSQPLIVIIETERAFRIGKARNFLRLISALRCTPVAECAG